MAKNSKECGDQPKHTGSVVESEDEAWKAFVKRLPDELNSD